MVSKYFKCLLEPLALIVFLEWRFEKGLCLSQGCGAKMYRTYEILGFLYYVVKEITWNSKISYFEFWSTVARGALDRAHRVPGRAP